MKLIEKIFKRHQEKPSEEELRELRELELESYKEINRNINMMIRKRREKVALDSSCIHINSSAANKKLYCIVCSSA